MLNGIPAFAGMTSNYTIVMPGRDPGIFRNAA